MCECAVSRMTETMTVAEVLRSPKLFTKDDLPNPCYEVQEHTEGPPGREVTKEKKGLQRAHVAWRHTSTTPQRTSYYTPHHTTPHHTTPHHTTPHHTTPHHTTPHHTTPHHTTPHHTTPHHTTPHHTTPHHTTPHHTTPHNTTPVDTSRQ